MKTRRTINQYQQALYWREWARARKELLKSMTPKEADSQRHVIHTKALGEDKSSKEFTNEDLDHVLRELKAIYAPLDITGQIDQANMPATRGRYKVRELLAALGKDEAHAEQLIRKRHEGGVLVTVHRETAATLETIGPDDLERIGLDLKAECKARWKNKGALLTEIRLMRMEGKFQEAETSVKIRRALEVEGRNAIESLGYDELLKLVATLRDSIPIGRPAAQTK